MGVFSPSGPASPSTVSVQSKTTLIIGTATVVGMSETSIAIPSGTVSFEIQAVGGMAKLTIASSGGGTSSTSTSWDIFPGNTYSEESLVGTSFTLFIKSSKPSTTVQIKRWT